MTSCLTDGVRKIAVVHPGWPKSLLGKENRSQGDQEARGHCMRKLTRPAVSGGVWDIGAVGLGLRMGVSKG